MLSTKDFFKLSLSSNTDEEPDAANLKAVSNIGLIHKESGPPGLLRALYALVLQDRETRRMGDHKKAAKLVIGHLTSSDGKLEEEPVRSTPFHGTNDVAWTLGGIIRRMEEELHLTPVNIKIIKEIISLPLKDLPGLASAMMEKLLSNNIPVNDRRNTFEATMKILAKMGPEQEHLISAIVEPLMDTFYADIHKPYSNIVGYNYRTADGSYNSLYFPDMGRSGTNYTRTVVPKSPSNTNLPPPALVFEKLLKRREFTPHPDGFNMLIFYIAIIITHDLFYTDSQNLMRNMTSSYADLSPLYGFNKYDQESVRLKKGGLLKPDTWFDMRLMLQPAGVLALLVLFSRNHNYIAKKLLEINENDRFSYGPGKLLATEEDQDNMLFQTARLINNGCYLNLIIHEYIRTIVGASPDTYFTLNPIAKPTNNAYGNIASIEFNYIYRWHMAIGEEDTEWINKVMEHLGSKISKQRATNPVSLPLDGAPVYPPATQQTDQSIFKALLPTFNEVFVHATPEELERGLPIPGLHRREDGTFSDADITKALRRGFTQMASALGNGQNTPAALMPVEIAGIIQSRVLQTCTFNDLRRHLNLMPLTTFEDFSEKPEVQEALRELYGTPDNVELYTGLMVERTKVTGMHLPYTMGRGILSDAVNLLRNDRIVNFELTPANITNWGAEYIAGDPNRNRRVFPSMLTNLLPEANPDGSPAFSDTELSTLFHVPRTE